MAARLLRDRSSCRIQHREETLFAYEPYDSPREVTVQRKDFDHIYDLWKERSDKGNVAAATAWGGVALALFDP